MRTLKTTKLLLLGLAIFMLPVSALATSYGDGGYNGCNYNGANCSTSSDTASSSTASTTSSSPSSGTTTTSTSGTGSTSAVGNIIDLDPFQTFVDGSGKDNSITTGAVFKFTLNVDRADNSSQQTANDNTKSVAHTITINTVGTDSVDITVASTPKNYTLKLLTPLLIDLTNDGVSDIGIEATAISPPNATIKTWKIFPVIIPPTKNAIVEWIPFALALSGAIILLLVPRRALIKATRFFNKPKGHGSGHGGHSQEEGLSRHIPHKPKKEHRGGLSGLPAHDFKSESGVVINAEAPLDEMSKADQKKIVVTEKLVFEREYKKPKKTK